MRGHSAGACSALYFLLTFAACSSGASANLDASGHVDASATIDAMTAVDAANSSDAAPANDAASPNDAALEDGAGSADALPADGGPADTGLVDASDAGDLDSGTSPDATTPDGGMLPDSGVDCGALGRSCTVGGPECGGGLECNMDHCFPVMPTCGGFAMAQCPNTAPVCLFYAHADYGPCFTMQQRFCICTDPNLRPMFPMCP